MLLHCAGRIIYHEGSLQRKVLRSQEVDPNRLSSEGIQIKTLQHIPGGPIQVRVGGKSRQYRIAGIANLYLQPVEGCSGRRLGRGDLDPETERHGRRR